jgi:ATP-dependent DNA ligase
VVDGEIVIAAPHGLDFDALQLRLHPAASRVAKLAAETPASFVAFDLLAAGGRDLRRRRSTSGATRLEQLLADARRRST